LSFDQKITDKATLFFRYGWADDKVNEVEDFFSFGGDIKGPFESRKDDVFGIAYALGLRSEKGLANTDARRIDLAEAYYRFKLNNNLSVSPHLQLVMDPGGLKSESPATVFGVRCRYTF
jgi:carbohydrate-selective porin OprB